MRDWRLDITDERAEVLSYLFHLLKEHREDFLDADFIEPVTKRDFENVIDWFEKSYDYRKARKAVKEKWSQ